MGRICRILLLASAASAIAFAWTMGGWRQRYLERDSFVARPIGVGDKLHLEVYDIHGIGGDEIADLEVGGQGSVRLPGIDRTLAVAGPSLSQAWGDVGAAYRSHNPYSTDYFGWPYFRFGRIEPPPVRLNLMTLAATAVLPALASALLIGWFICKLRRQFKVFFNMAAAISFVIWAALYIFGLRRGFDLTWNGGIEAPGWLTVDGVAVSTCRQVRCMSGLRPPRGAYLVARIDPRSHEAWIPASDFLWAAAILPLAKATAIAIGFPSLRKRRRRERLRAGLCLNCGYDLRATRNRCPECGRVNLNAGEPIST